MKKLFILLIAVGLVVYSLTGCDTSAQSGGDEKTAAYEGSIFDTSYVHEINVEIEEDDWADLLENPTEKTKYSADVTVDGASVSNVSFATKGNTSLSQVASTDSERYSFKINFGKYVDGQTFDGLDVLNLNNTFADATYLKDYFSYRIMAEAGVDAPLVSFVSLSINGEPYGLYVAIEEISDSFLARNYGEEAGGLYKPETSQLDNIGAMGGGQAPGDGWPFSEDGELPDIENGQFPAMTGGERPDMEGRESPFPDGGERPAMGEGEPPTMEEGQLPMMGSLSNGADLVYTDDELSNYSDIFDNAKTDVDDVDMQRVVEALKQLSTGEDLESCVDVEATLRYFMAHNFVINYDSYTGSMLHNYYLYEEDGILTMLPWDYNLAFGGFNNNTGADATDLVNWPMDSPLDSRVSEEERPMWSQLAANEEYLEIYHTYFDELLANYFESGRFEDELNTVYELIYPYVESDPTAFYTLEEFEEAAATLKTFCLLRAESLRGQLSGDIPSTASGQQEDSSSLIDAGDIDISAMGSMNMGGAGGGFGGDWEGGPGGGPQNRGPDGRPDFADGENSNEPPQ